MGKVDDERGRKFADDFSKECTTLFDFIRKNQLYFGKRLAEKLSSLFFAIQQPLYPLISKADDVAPDSRRAEFIAYWDTNGENITKTMDLVEAEFRALLGSGDT